VTLAEAISRLYDLRPGTTPVDEGSPHERRGENHNRAMDRRILAPGPDRRWHISPLIDPRRSNGEMELGDLAGKSLLLPGDPAFYPNEEGLAWRMRQLVA
jgi:hypothetical protein